MSDVKTVGPYTLVGVIGQGGMGRVYRARQAGLDREVALKVISPQHADDLEVVRRFQREAHVMSRVQHPNVVRVLDSGVAGEVLYLAMELLEGRTLRDVLGPGRRIPVLDAVAMARDLCRGLEAVHEAGLVHRDIKPANVMVTRDGAPKLMDFGLAKDPRATALTADGETPGTPAYIPPELVLGEPGDHRVDLYQAGLLLYVSVCGRLPHDTRNLSAYLQAVVQERATPPSAFNPDVPHALDQVVLSALAREPGARPATARAMADALDRVFVDGSLARMKRPGEVAAAAPPRRAESSRTSTPPAPATAAQAAPRARTPASRAALPLVALAVLALAGGYLASRPKLSDGQVPPPPPRSASAPPELPTALPREVRVHATPSVAAPPPPAAAVAACCRELTQALAAALPASRFEAVRNALRDAVARKDAAAAKAVQERCRADVARTFGPLRELVQRYERLEPYVAECAPLTSAERSALLRAVGTAQLWRRFLIEAFGGRWDVPELAAPGMTLAPGAVGTVAPLQVIAVPAPAAFNEAEVTFVSDARADFRVPRLPDVGMLARAVLAFKLAGGDPTARLIVRIAPPSDGLDGYEAAILEAAGADRAVESAVVIDPRLLVRGATLTVHYEHQSTRFGSKPIVLPLLTLLGASR